MGGKKDARSCDGVRCGEKGNWSSTSDLTDDTAEETELFEYVRRRGFVSLVFFVSRWSPWRVACRGGCCSVANRPSLIGIDMPDS